MSTWNSRAARPGALLQLLGQGGQELQSRRGELPPEAELRRRADEERLCLDRVEAGQLRPVAALQAVAARGAPDGDDRDSRSGERLRVALDRPLGDLETLGELVRGELPSRLQNEQEGDEAARAHGWSLCG